VSEYFIKHISIKDCNHIGNIEIPLGDSERRRHLVLTGKNGSGKTTTLKEINTLLNKLINNSFATIEQHRKNIESYINAKTQQEKNIENFNMQIEQQKKLFETETNEQKISQINNHIKSYEANIISSNSSIEDYKINIVKWQQQIDDFLKVDLTFSSSNHIYEDIVNGKFILAFFEAKRENIPTVPKVIDNVNLNKKNNTDTKNIHKQFISYMVNLRVEKLDAQDLGDIEEATKIQQWFDNFENTLKKLFQKDDLELRYFRKEKNFKILYDDKEFGLNELSDGYSSLLAIVTELILRMEAHEVKAYDMQGVVLIDEVETHLHVDLQKKVLPFLVDFFPKIQFIVTTHSPFVLSSLSNVVICDLENNIITEDLSSYSYEALVDTYFNINKYSEELANKIEKFKNLATKKQNQNISHDERIEYNKMVIYFEQIPIYKNEELGYILNQIKLNDLQD
jgi:predicted ATP-binding protein involved in virulence